MSKKLQLHIAEPCHENWDNMNPVEKGRFCDACQKQVVDFSMMSDREIVQFFKKPSTGSVCGRFMNEQLDRDMVIEKKRLPWIKYFFQFVFPAFVISKQAYTQGVLIRRMPAVDTPSTAKGEVKKPTLPVELKVVVIDSATHLPVPYASVNIIGLNMDSQVLNDFTKADGSVLFQLKNKHELDVEISSVGYKSETITIAPEELSNNKTIRVALNVDIKEMQEVTVVSGTVKGRLTRTFITYKRDTTWTYSTVDKGLPPQSKATSSKIFPNPLPQAQTATIEINAKQNGWIYAMIVDANGKMMAMQKWNAVKGVNRFTVDATAKMIPGIYFIRLTNEKGKMIRIDQLVIQ